MKPAVRHPESPRLPKPRRGVVLLIVLSLLTLFVLLGVSYAIIASKAQYAADTNARVAQLGDPLPTETDLVMTQILCDTNARTALQYHSLLRDLYGDDSVSGVVQGVGPALSAYGAQQDYDYKAAGAGNAQIVTFLAIGTFSQIPHYYAGRVLTFTTGRAANISTRIVDSYYNVGNLSLATPLPPYVFAIEALSSDSIASLLPSDGDAFLINGAPFNGAGAGFDPTTGNLDAILANVATSSSLPQTDLVSLLPHFAGYDMTSLPGSPTQGPRNWVVTNAASATPNILSANSVALGGVDEPWDAPDIQNMLLAMVPPAAAQAYAYAIANNDPTKLIPIIPSLHRPELINYWVNFIKQTILLPAGVPDNGLANVQTQLQIIAYPYGLDRIPNTGDESTFFDDSSPEKSRYHLTRIYNIMHGCIFRPMPWDHPNFTGGNPKLSGPLTGINLWQCFNNLIDIPNPPLNTNPQGGDPPNPTFGNRAFYDVDNDGDGIPDSIWFDPGLPVITTKDGRRIKRLAAILVKDLDGSIDLNAHGNLAQVVNPNFRADTMLQLGMVSGYNPQPNASPKTTALGIAALGAYVPRGIGFGPAEVDFLNILAAPGVIPAYSDANAYQAYQELLLGRYTSTQNLDTGATARPGLPGVRDPLSFLKHYGIPDSYGYPNPVNFLSWYASPPDVWGRGAVVLDVGGQPIWANTAPNGGEMLDTPYELALSGNTDSRYTPAELERLLRYHDPDSMNLPDRLLRLAGTTLAPGYQTYPYFKLNTDEPPGQVGQNNVSHARRNMFTVVSSHIPVPATTVPQEMRNGSDTNLQSKFVTGMGSTSILDLYRAKILSKNSSYTEAQVGLAMQAIVPWEFFHGQKFDINRWLGNAFDDQLPPGGGGNTNGVADDPAEAGNETVWPLLPPTQFPNYSPYSSQNPVAPNKVVTAFPGNGVGLSTRARQLYARHLYCLAMLLGAEKFIPVNCPQESALDSTPPNPNLQYKRLLARRVAQWAINCVDFRDPDAIMTPFEFDLEPFTDNDGNLANGTWDVDGWVGTFPGPDGILGNADDVTPSPDDDESTYPYRNVVWGAEYPDLLITETFAFHDRRCKDTKEDPSGKDRGAPSMPDQTLDQFRVPQGSLYFELYCTRGYQWGGPPNWLTGQPPVPGTPNNQPIGQQPSQKPRLPRELYDINGRLVLSTANNASPVWRIALAKLQGFSSNQYHPQKKIQNTFESTSFDPNNMTLLSPAVAPIPNPPTEPLIIERYVYFGHGGTVPPIDQQKSFTLATNSTPVLQPGQYAVVGPRSITYLGSQDPNGSTTNPAPTPGSLWGGNSPQRIELGTAAANPAGVLVTDTSGATTSRPTTQIRPCVPIICSMHEPGSAINNVTPSGWSSARQVGLNITEPLPSGNYYQQPTFTPTATKIDFYDDPDAATPGGGIVDEPEDSDPNRPLGANNMQPTGTYLNSSAAFLQRLANPLLLWNPLPTDPVYGGLYNAQREVNPYITVDWSTIDVSVFNGEEDDNRKVNGNPIDPYDSDPWSLGGGGQPLHFRTRQRAFPNTPPAALANPWPTTTLNGTPLGVTKPTTVPVTGPYFTVDLSNDLTYAKTGGFFQPYYLDDPPPPPVPPAPPQNPRVSDRHTLGYLNEPLDQLLVQEWPSDYPANQQAFNLYLGEPAKPFPWFTWNSRPFANPMELMLVPSSSPERMLSEFCPGPMQNFLPQPNTGAYYDPSPAGQATTNRENTFRAPFGHLFNFFDSSDTRVSGGLGTSQADQSSYLFRLLDYVEVPSPYVGTERWYNPQSFYFQGSVPPPYANQYVGATTTPNPYYFPPPYYLPPFNKASRFRDPGRININTIFHENVWIAATGQFPGMNTPQFALSIFLSRQGDGSNNLLQINPRYPTRFANPFRPADCADLMPNQVFNPVQPPYQQTPVPTMRKYNPIEATLMRPGLDISNNPTVPSKFPQFQQNTGQVFNDCDRNPYFRFQAYQKLGNVLTTQSNCYAVWITMGYFEVEDNLVQLASGPAQLIVDAAHPDGLQLGQEVGGEKGDLSRHRAFYIIDRSIPVGFKPGSRLNTDDCILLKRLIE